MTFQHDVNRNIEVSPPESIGILISMFDGNSSLLLQEYHSNIIFRSMLFKAVREVDAWKDAYRKPTGTV